MQAEALLLQILGVEGNLVDSWPKQKSFSFPRPLDLNFYWSVDNQSKSATFPPSQSTKSPTSLARIRALNSNI